MTRPDDSTLDPENLRVVEEQAHRLLDRADAWDRYPVPVDDILLRSEGPPCAYQRLRSPTTIVSYRDEERPLMHGARIKNCDKQGLRSLRRRRSPHTY